MSFNRFYVISPLALVAVSACRSPYTQNTAVSGNIVKGPLSNALVFLDLDGDNVLDANEQSIRTDANGKFTINTNSVNYKIVALTDESTVDTSSGAILAGVTLSAPKGAAVVTPTTTLMEEGGLTASEVAEVLGLPDGVDPLTFNPFEAGVDAAQALAVEKVSQQIITAVSSFASAAEGAGASEKGAFEAALKSVVDVVKVKAEKIKDPNAAAADKKIDFTKAADLDLIKAKVADEAEKIVTSEGTTGFSKAALTSLVNDTATSIKNVNDQIGAVTDLTSDASKNVFSTLQVLQDQVKNAAIAEKATPGSGSIDFKDAAKVKTAADNKAPTDIKLSAASITEGSKDLVIGSLSTTDYEQTSGFKYEIAKVKGTDHALFSINSKGELVLNSAPDYSKQSSYKLFVTTTDSGGKKFSKELSIDVLKKIVTDNTSAIDGSHYDTIQDNENENVKPEPAPIPPLAPLNTTIHKITVSNGKFLIDGKSHESFELVEGKTYRFDTSDVSNNSHDFKFLNSESGKEITNKVVTFGTAGSKDAFSQITLKYASPDIKITCKNTVGMELALTTKTPYSGTLIQIPSGKSAKAIPFACVSSMVGPFLPAL